MVLSIVPFNWEYKFGSNSKVIVNENLEIPSPYPVDEIVGRVAAKFNVPNFAISELQQALSDLINRETQQYFDVKTKELSVPLLNGDIDIELIAQSWDDACGKYIAGYSKPIPIDDEEIFAQCYSKLIHSNKIDGIIKMEQQFSLAVSTMVDQKDMFLANLDETLREETERNLAKFGVEFSEREVNLANQKLVTDRQFHEGRWISDLMTIKSEQRNDYRTFVMSENESSQCPDEEEDDLLTCSGEDYLNNDSRSQKTRKSRFSVSSIKDNDKTTTSKLPVWEESFTIQLGRQSRSSHNIRLMCADLVEMCRWDCHDDTPQRLHTALSLYSHQLSAMVLLVDNRVNTFKGIKNRFSGVCERSSDFHFLELDVQLDEIRKTIRKINQSRKPTMREELLETPLLGEVYVTRHSNLANHQVVFHLVVDDSVFEEHLRYPSPIHTALRNILQTCFLHDITTLSIPLLLTHTLKEHMNVAWCSRRVETIFKAVKGTMIELCTWRGKDSRNIQFILPTEINEEMFHTFSKLFCEFFQLSNPLRC